MPVVPVPGDTDMCHALIVEDNSTFRQSLRETLLARFPFMSIEEAGEGGEALRKLNAFAPEIVFMDIQLPGENGLELTRNIRAGHAGLIIIVLTSYDLPEYREAAMQSGADYFFSKVYNTGQEITGLVDAILANRT
jgi:DNA-binding NarL/FixJ family response regulator